MKVYQLIHTYQQELKTTFLLSSHHSFNLSALPIDSAFVVEQKTVNVSAATFTNPSSADDQE